MRFWFEGSKKNFIVCTKAENKNQMMQDNLKCTDRNVRDKQQKYIQFNNFEVHKPKLNRFKSQAILEVEKAE